MKMNWRAMLLSGVLAAGLSVTFVPRVAADPPPWAGKWKHHDKDGDHHWREHRGRDHDRDDHDWRDNDRWRWQGDHSRREDWWRRHRADEDANWRRWHDRPRYDGYRPNYGGYRYDGRNDGRYGQLMQRMNNDRAKINEIAPTGRHRKALQWYQGDLRNAQRDLDNYQARR
jgi:hypothetical protein